MATFDPLLDTEELHTELLKTIDSKLDVLNLKVEELAASTTARLAHLDSRLEATISSLPNFRHLDEILSQLLERTAPKSACVFCSIEENVDSHHSGRCPRFPDTYSRTFQASKLGLCGRCLKLAHQGDCGIMCGFCRQGHNSLLCPSKGNPHHMAKKRKA